MSDEDVSSVLSIFTLFQTAKELLCWRYIACVSTDVMLVVEISPEELSSSLIPCSPDGAVMLDLPSEVDESPFELIEELL